MQSGNCFPMGGNVLLPTVAGLSRAILGHWQNAVYRETRCTHSCTAQSPLECAFNSLLIDEPVAMSPVNNINTKLQLYATRRKKQITHRGKMECVISHKPARVARGSLQCKICVSHYNIFYCLFHHFVDNSHMNQSCSGGVVA